MRTLLILTSLFASASVFAAEQPTIVELFTSKYCPSCPAAEKYLDKRAQDDTNLMIIMENVDYWNRPQEGKTDPHGHPDFTQRQYDYSNLLADRPGKVFTPQPIINGTHVAEPPFFLNWNPTLAAARQNSLQPLSLTHTADGVLISLPAGLEAGREYEVTIVGLEREPNSSLWRAKGLRNIAQKGDTLAISQAQLPAGTHLLTLLQLVGPGKIVASGLLKNK